jgi:hypothetical protein
LLADAEPMLEDAVPLAKDVDKTVVNFKDPVITRLKGPVTSALVDAWHGTGPFAGNGNDNPLYKEVGYLAARGNLQSIYGSKNGTHLALELGLGFSTPGGNDLGFSALVQQAFGIIPIPDGLAQSIGYPSTDTDPVTVSSGKSPVIETPAAEPLTDGLLDLFKGLGSVTQGGSQ